MNNLGRININSSNEDLVTSFNWAKQQALEYVFHSEKVGPWYEASLPGRRAFCMRDVAHHSGGAHVLGLEAHTKNMLKKFAENISESKLWCSYWEINDDNEPAPVDYKNDKDFWYNLPANFDVMECCYRQYLWTSDRDYIEDPVFVNFYQKTVDEYVKLWDVNQDGLLEYREGLPPYMGIPTYMEDYVGDLKIFTGVDLLALQYGGYQAYAQMRRISGDLETSQLFAKKAADLKTIFNTKWWSEENKNYYSIELLNGDKKGASAINIKADAKLFTPVPLMFDIINDNEKVKEALHALLSYDNRVIELESYFPEILFKHGYPNEAFHFIKDLSHETKYRREYPEVSYNVVYAVIDGMLGLKPNGEARRIETKVQLPDDVQWLEVNEIPVFNGTLDVKVVKNEFIEITNHSDEPIAWTSFDHQNVIDTVIEANGICVVKFK